VSDELVFTVEGSKAQPAERVSLPEVGLTERADLQEWVLEHPAILGDGVMIVTFEFDRWWSASGSPLDRLDVLGLDRSGRLVVAELKRDVAPDTVEMQAIKYAAMASRFTTETVAAQHAKFLGGKADKATDEEALERLEAHTETGVLTNETLRNPRIVLLAASFPAVVTATAVWLREVGVDITLMRFQAYRTQLQTLVTVSQLLPLRDLEEFTVIPRATVPVGISPTAFPTLPWTAADYVRLREVATNQTIVTLLDLCSSQPDQTIPLGDLEEQTGRTRHELRADLAQLTMLVKRKFGRGNWPLGGVWAAGGDQQMYYVMDEESAALWRNTAESLSIEVDTGVIDDSPPTPVVP
jgi:hypothetical protein